MLKGLVLSAAALCLVAGTASIAAGTTAIPTEGGLPMERARMLSAFGERAAFSPDGKRVAFVGKSYGDAYEVELATGRVRNLTGHLPHQGVLRVQYLSNGDYLILGPKRNIGPASRFSVNLFVLDKNLQTGLQPLDQGVYEGVAMGPRNTIAFQQVPAGARLQPGERWVDGVLRVGLEHYTARVEYREGRAVLVDKRRILNPAPEGCGFMEVQDFRRDGQELIFFTGCRASGEMRIYGYDLATGKYTNYLATRDYAEVEGIAPDGKWTTVECGIKKEGERDPPLDICRLDLVPNGRLSRLIVGTAPGGTSKVSNPVVSPDGKAIAFQTADLAIGEVGEGGGIYLMPLGN